MEITRWIWILLFAFVAWTLWTKFRGRLSSEKAKALIESGALVLDVRTPGEFSSRQLPGAVNLPLSEITAKIGQLEANKDRTILCFCLSGARSGMAVGRLRKSGYTQVFNLGSYHRATTVLQSVSRGDADASP